MPSHAASRRDRLLSNLKEQTQMSEKELDEFKYYVTASDYFSRDDHSGGTVGFGEKHYRSNGVEHTIAHVPWKKLCEEVEGQIKKKIPQERRADVFDKVMEGIPPSLRPENKERRPIVNPHEKPATKFSVSRAPPESVRSNAQIIEDLTLATNLDDLSKDSFVTKIVYEDAQGDEKRSCSVTMSGEGRPGKVHGGRLGRDHTLDDVPNHFVRDQVMNIINNFILDQDKERALDVVFADLKPAEIRQYSALIRKEHDKAMTERMQAEDRLEEILKDPLVRSVNEAENILRQEDEIDAIPDDIDMTPHKSYGFRDYEVPEPIFRSVVKPGRPKRYPQEESLHMVIGTTIDRDCDQLRLMIKRLVLGKKWTLDEFRIALGGISRPQLTGFLEKRGPKEGKRSYLFGLTWEFFKKREALGLDVMGEDHLDDEVVMREAEAANKAKKRSPEETLEAEQKRTKVIEEAQAEDPVVVE